MVVDGPNYFDKGVGFMKEDDETIVHVRSKGLENIMFASGQISIGDVVTISNDAGKIERITDYNNQPVLGIVTSIQCPKGECGAIDCACYVDPLRKLARMKIEEKKMSQLCLMLGEQCNHEECQ